MLHSKFLKNSSGFTLVELMVAVGITGALTTVAVPNYLKYVAKSRESEAKIALSAIYVGEKQFGVEYGYYTACLTKIGYTPTSDRYYAVGYSNAKATDTKCGTPGNLACNTIPTACTAGPLLATYADADLHETVYGAKLKAGSSFPADADLGSISNGVGKIAFSVGAAGSISSGSTLDKWQVNQNKVLSNVQSGI